MDTQSIVFSAAEQVLTKDSGSDEFASNTVAYVEATFTLGDNWSDFDSVSAVWKSSYYTIATVLDSNGTCTVPAEVMYYASKVYVNLVGSVLEDETVTDRLTTSPLLAFMVTTEAEIEGTETAEITASQFEQFVSQVEDSATSAAESAAAAEASAEEATEAAEAFDALGLSVVDGAINITYTA